MISDITNQLFELIMAADRQAANKLIDSWAGIHGFDRAVFDVLEPALEMFGEKWSQEEEMSLAQGYIAAKIAEDVMVKASRLHTWKDTAGDLKGPVVVGNIEDDYHALGRKLVVVFLRSSGWEVYDLGNDVLAAEFVDKALDVGAKVIGASAMMDSTAVNIKKLRHEIDQRCLTGKIRLAVGGAVFKLRSGLIEEVGGEGTAGNALEVSKLMEDLLRSIDEAAD